jgi:HAD superfamily hydrolase (TIGR01509 family)
MRPQANVHLGSLRQGANHAAGAMEYYAHLCRLFRSQISDPLDVPRGLDHEGADTQRPDAVLHTPAIAFIDQAAWEIPPSMGQVASDAALQIHLAEDDRIIQRAATSPGTPRWSRYRPVATTDAGQPQAPQLTPACTFTTEQGRHLCKSRHVDDAGSGETTSAQVLLFDLGGVVLDIDFDRVFHAWAVRASCDPQALRRRFKFDDAYERHERGELDASGYFASLRRSLRLRLSDDDFVAGWSELYVAPVPGMVAVLPGASERFPLYAFTNSNPTHQAVWATRYAPELSVFRSIFVSSEIGLRKPDPRAFSEIARRTGFPASAFMFFDDTLENVMGARTAGMQAVHVRSTDDVRVALLKLNRSPKSERRGT